MSRRQRLRLIGQLQNLRLNGVSFRLVLQQSISRYERLDDASQVGPLLERLDGPVASFTGDGVYGQDSVPARD